MGFYKNITLILSWLILYLENGKINAKSLQEVSVPALGRPFALGDLYDRRRDYIIEGPKLWNHDELSNYVETVSPSTEFDVKASQSIDQSMSNFGLSASLKMSFLAGLISVSGSASYMDHRKKKNNVARVSLNYQSTSFTRRLRSDLFAKVTFPDVLKNAEDATDVVVAIQYGAGAIFSFEKSIHQNEVAKEVEGSLKVIVHKIPKFKIEGSGKVHIGAEDRKAGENLSCTFHGDFVLKRHPGTFEEAIKVYKELPSLLGEKYENSVPVKVWLYPIEKLPIKKTAMKFYEIKESMVTSVTNVVSDLEEVTRKCNDILDSSVSLHHSRIRRKVKQLHDFVQRYVLLFKQKLAAVSPQIRKGEMSSNVLVKMLNEKEHSPFSKKLLNEWIQYYTEEVNVLSRIQSLPNYCRNDGEFSSKLLKNVQHTIGLTLKLGTMREDYLSSLEKYLLDKQTEGPSNVLQNMPPKWWQPGSRILSDLLELSNSFKNFYELRRKRNNLENSGIQFLVREENLSDKGKKGISIELYEQGTLKDGHYELTGPPTAPTCASKTHDTIYLKWNKPEKGQQHLKGFKVIIYDIKKENDSRECDGMYCKVGEAITSGDHYNVAGLKSQYPYYFTVSSYTKLGETSVSEMSAEVLTSKCSPGTYQTAKHQCKECPPGKYADESGMLSCIECPAGTYNHKSGGKSIKACTKCPAGTYDSKKGSSSINECIKCPVGTFNKNVGSSSASLCVKCPAGYFNDRVGAVECVKCKTNSYNPDIGQSACMECPTGSESKSQGAKKIEECITLDPALVLDRKIDVVKQKVEVTYKEMRKDLHATEERITGALDYSSKETTGLSDDITRESNALRAEYHAIHDCKWLKGESISTKPFIQINKDTKESCVYNCIKLKQTTHPKINGVMRKLSNKACFCVEEMTERAPTTRYESCKLPTM